MLRVKKGYNSPNFEHRPPGTAIDTIIIHYTEMLSCEAAIERLCDVEAGVSSHYIISKTGDIFNLVDEQNRAFHAGESYWDGREKVNDFSIGIELDNNGKETFEEPLMKSLIALCHDIKKRHRIKYVLGHSDVAPQRKKDPGRLFDWSLLAKEDIGLYPQKKLSTQSHVSASKEKSLGSRLRGNDNLIEIQQKLQAFGYKIDLTGIFDLQTENVVKAFSDHFYPDIINNKIDQIFVKILDELLHIKCSL